MPPINHPHPKPFWSRELEEKIREAAGTIRFGTLTLVIQDGRIIQLDKNEKIKLA